MLSRANESQIRFAGSSEPESHLAPEPLQIPKMQSANKANSISRDFPHSPHKKAGENKKFVYSMQPRN